VRIEDAIDPAVVSLLKARSAIALMPATRSASVKSHNHGNARRSGVSVSARHTKSLNPQLKYLQ